MTGKTILAILTLICLIGSISVVSAGKETQLTQNQRLVCSTAIYGNYVTWYETSGNGVNVYDLTKGIMLNVPQNDGDSGNIPIYGSKIVWHDMSDNITMYDINTNEETQISTSSYSPDINGNYIVYDKSYTDHRDPYTLYNSVFLYDLALNKETQITQYGTAYYTPVIYGNKIAWSRTDANYKTDIYLYDIPTRQISSVSTSRTANSPDIYGNIIVWSEAHNGRSNIYMRDISKQKTTQITTTGTASNPAIYGNRIVYQSSYSMSDVYVSNIYMYDISTGKTTQITNCGCAWSPSIFNDKIVYVDSHAAGTYNFELGNIYLYDLSAKPVKPTATFTADKTSGVAPLRVQFTSTTTGNPTDYYWVFEPSTSSDWNSHHAVTAGHTFTKPGKYTVSLTVTNGAGSDMVNKKDYITVTAKPSKPVASFTANKVSGKHPLTVTFTYAGTGGTPDTYLWKISDGKTYTQKIVTDTFIKAGTYTVSLTVTNTAGSSTATKTINVF